MIKYRKIIYFIVFLFVFNCEYISSSKVQSNELAASNKEDPLVKKGLPPDPGKLGEMTLLGIDSDGDGVRDDIQRLIFEKYPDQPLIQKALLQYARDKQNTFRYVDNRQKAIPLIKKELDSQECASDVFEIIFGDPIPPFLENDWMIRFDNTVERLKADRILDSYFSGQVSILHDSDNPGITCEFKIDHPSIKKQDKKDKMELKKGK